MAESTQEPTPEQTAAEPDSGATTATADPGAELAAAKARAEENYRNWQRSAADFANFKRRIDDERKFAERWLLQDVLPVLDDFERAWAALPRELRNLTWIEGVWQVNAKLYGVLQKHGITPIETEGREFNPLEHEAVLHEDGDPADQTAIVAELQRGYRLHERVLRPALVKVGRRSGAAGGEEDVEPEAGAGAPGNPEGSAADQSPPAPQ